MFNTTRLFLCAGNYKPLVLLVLVLFSVANCHGNQTHQQFTNSCGDIPNISFPFHLEGDSSYTCRDKNYTLSCENNRTILSLDSGKYYVQSIHYNNYTIRLVDVGIQTSNICSSFPLHSLTQDDFLDWDPFYVSWNVRPVVFLSCENPIYSPNIYINRSAYCKTGFGGGYSYVVAGYDITVSDVADSCSVEMITLSSSPLLSNATSELSFLDVNKELEYGSVVSWWTSFRGCKMCRKQASCFGDSLNVKTACRHFCTSITWLIIMNIQSLMVLIIARILLCAPCVFGFLIYKFRRRHLSTFDSIEDFLRSENHLVPIRYSYADIKKMTKGFRDKLGEGGYGTVYKGKLRSGNLAAIKMLSKPKADGQEFINEVATIGRIRHVNVVQLIGYCAERSKRALVYDFMPNGSLEKYIFSEEGNFCLSCEQMYRITIGVARGIEYLHRGCDMQILHFDIKPHNILLDENFTPKVSDFGLARLYPTDESIVSLTAVRGTMGYIAPELFYKNIGGVSYKADVYSFGMLLMEMAGRRNWNPSANSSQIFFPSWVYDQFVEGRHVEMGQATEEESEMVKKMMLVGLWCIQMRPGDRPSMTKVVEMLERNIESLHMPPKPFMYPQGMPVVNHGTDVNATILPNLSGACGDSIISDLSGR